jgi:hypothetical protein
MSRSRNHFLTYREKNCRRGRLRPRQDNLGDVKKDFVYTTLPGLSTRSARSAYGCTNNNLMKNIKVVRVRPLRKRWFILREK